MRRSSGEDDLTERMVIYLGENLDFVETEGLPKFIGERAYKLGSLPSEERFKKANVLVWSQRSNDRFVYLGLLEDAFVDREARVLRFTCFRRLARPVVICGGDDVHRAELYAGNEWFLDRGHNASSGMLVSYTVGAVVECTWLEAGGYLPGTFEECANAAGTNILKSTTCAKGWARVQPRP